jgi:hypothetical protein
MPVWAPGRCRAQALAGQMFANAGIDLKWKTGRPQPDAIVVEIAAGAPAGVHPEAQAYARPSEGVHIRVFYDRIETIAALSSRPRFWPCAGPRNDTHSGRPGSTFARRDEGTLDG